MKLNNKNLKENVLLTIGAVLYFVLILINEILFQLEYLLKRSKKSQKFFINTENELIRKRLEKDSRSKLNTLAETYKTTDKFSLKIIAFPNSKNADIHTSISIQHYDLKWLNNSKDSF